MYKFNSEQSNAIKFDTGKFVEANAGSGKTTVLTTRFINIILDKVDKLTHYFISQIGVIISYEIDIYNSNISLNELEFAKLNSFILKYLKDNFKFDFAVIVSFSENTSNDLIEKINRDLIKIRNENINENNLNTNIKYLILNYLIENVYNFQISTIHAFCNTIISNFTNELNIDESYNKNDFYIEQISKVRTSIIINDINLLKLFILDKNILIKNEPIDFNRFHDIFLNLYKLNGSKYIHSNFEQFIWKISNGNSIIKLQEAISNFENKISELNSNLDLKYTEKQDLEMYELALEYNSDVKYFAEVVFEVLNSIHEEQNLINFDNQLYKTYNFLSSPENALKISEKIEYLLVDEFQDTDLIQYSIFKFLSDSSPTMNVFFVGDPKQSIYRFRSSDVTVFNKAKDYFLEQNKVESIILNQSYRNTPVVSSFVNTFFKQKSNEFANINKQYNYTNLVYPIGIYEDTNNETPTDFINRINSNSQFNPNSENKVNLLNTGNIIYLVGYKTSDGEKKSKITRENHNLDTYSTELYKTSHYLKLAEFIHKIVNSDDYLIDEKIKINDNEEKILKRRIEFKDIAVLSTKHINSKLFKDYFDKYKIPFQIKKTKDFYNLDEIISSIDFLTFVNNPNDSEALICLLKSNFFGFRLESLFVLAEMFILPNNLSDKYLTNLSFWDKLQKLKTIDFEIVNEKISQLTYKNQNNPTEIYNNLNLVYTSILQVIDILELFILLKSKVFSSELLTMFFKSNENYQNTHINDEVFYENLNKFVNILHDIEQSGYVQFNDIMSQIKIKKFDTSEENILDSDNENSVSFYTFHSSKGLEFPVVFVMQIGGDNNNQKDIEIEKEYGVYNESYINQDINDNELSENETLIENNDINSKFIRYQKHHKSFAKNQYFETQIKEYDEIDNLNVDYVAMTRAKNILCFVFRASNSITQQNAFNGREKAYWKRLDFNENVMSLKFENKENIFKNYYELTPIKKEEEVLFEYFNPENNERNSVNSKISIDYYFYDYISLLDIYEIDKQSKDIENLSIQSQNPNSNDINLEKNVNNKFYLYQYESKYKTFSATKLMSLADNRNKYEFKYLLGLSDDQSIEIETSQNKEYDEFILIPQKENDSEKNLKVNDRIKQVKNMENAATFGKAFHEIIQHIIELYPNKKLNTEFLNDLIENTKIEYQNLNDEKINKIKLILNKLSLSSLLDKILENPESVKTEFAIKMPFKESHFHYLNGNIDLIYQDNDNNFHIIDWKTNSEKVGDSKYQYDLQRKLYTYMIQYFNPDSKVNFSLVYTQDILNHPEENWETKFEIEVVKENVELEINKLITEIIELETSLYE